MGMQQLVTRQNDRCMTLRHDSGTLVPCLPEKYTFKRRIILKGCNFNPIKNPLPNQRQTLHLKAFYVPPCTRLKHDH